MLEQHFNEYIAVGLKPIPLYPRSKRPIGKEWNQEWSENAARTLFSLHPNANVGLLLGDIVDVEGDTDEANDLINRLTLGCRHPKFQSSKSVHHLFLNPDPSLTRLSRKGVEFRAHKHQSMAPPSIHPNGCAYVWLSEFTFIPELPESLFDLYQQLKSERVIRHRKKQQSTVKKVVCPACGRSCTVDKVRYKLEVQAFRTLESVWMCKSCRAVDLRPVCRSVKKELRRPRYNRLS